MHRAYSCTDFLPLPLCFGDYSTTSLSSPCLDDKIKLTWWSLIHIEKMCFSRRSDSGITILSGLLCLLPHSAYSPISTNGTVSLYFIAKYLTMTCALILPSLCRFYLLHQTFNFAITLLIQIFLQFV